MATKKNASWTLADQTTLLNYLIEHKAEGESGGFKKSTWVAAAIEVNKAITTGGRKTFDSCKSKFRTLKATYIVVCAIRENSGWSWDNEKGADITPEKKGTWDDYLAKNPAAEPFRNAGWVHLALFDTLEPSSARGAHVFRATQHVGGSEFNEESQAGTVDEEEAGRGSSSEEEEADAKPSTPARHHSSPPTVCKRAASPNPETKNKRIRPTAGTKMINDLNLTMNRVTAVIEKALCPPASELPPTPTRIGDTMTEAVKLEEEWLTPTQLAKLIIVFECDKNAIVSYQRVKRNEVLRKAWVCMKIGIEVEVDY